MRRLRAAGIFTQIAIAPMLPNHPQRFADLAAEASDRVIVDTYFDGDGAHGRRSRALGIGELYEGHDRYCSGRIIAVVASVIFPPAMVAIPLVAVMPLGQNGDLIIAVDSCRVTNAVDFEEQMTDVQPGEIVYLTVVRDGNRVQIAVQLPARTD